MKFRSSLLTAMILATTFPSSSWAKGDKSDRCSQDESRSAFYSMNMTLTTSTHVECSPIELDVIGKSIQIALDDCTLHQVKGKNGATKAPEITIVKNTVCPEAQDNPLTEEAQSHRHLAFQFVYRGGGFCRGCWDDNSDGRRLASTEYSSRALTTYDNVCVDKEIDIKDRLKLGCTQLCESDAVYMWEKKKINCASYDPCFDETKDTNWKEKKGCSICGNPSVPMCDKGKRNCDDYVYCLDEKVIYTDKIMHGCEICTNPSVKDDDKEKYHCLFDEVTRSYLPRDHWCLEPLANTDDKEKAGCDICNDIMVPMCDKKKHKCETYNICKDPEENCKDKIKAGCDICDDASVEMKDKKHCDKYDMCLDKDVDVDEKVANNCDICFNLSIQEKQRLDLGCSPLLSVDEIIRAALELTDEEKDKEKKREYVGDVNPENAAAITIKVVLPKEPKDLTISIEDLALGKVVWDHDYYKYNPKKDGVVSFVLWLDTTKRYVLTIEEPDEVGTGMEQGIPRVDVWLNDKILLVHDEFDFKGQRGHLLDVSSVVDSKFSDYITAMEKHLNLYLTRAIANTFGKSKPSCLCNAKPTITVEMEATSLVGASGVCGSQPGDFV